MRAKYSKEQIMVLIGCCLFQCAMIGILINCIGVLFAQIRAELGFSMSRVSLYNTLKSVSTSLSAGVITAIFFKANKARFLLLNQCAIVMSFLLIIWGGGRTAVVSFCDHQRSGFLHRQYCSSHAFGPLVPGAFRCRYRNCHGFFGNRGCRLQSCLCSTHF